MSYYRGDSRHKDENRRRQFIELENSANEICDALGRHPVVKSLGCEFGVYRDFQRIDVEISCPKNLEAMLTFLKSDDSAAREFERKLRVSHERFLGGPGLHVSCGGHSVLWLG